MGGRPGGDATPAAGRADRVIVQPATDDAVEVYFTPVNLVLLKSYGASSRSIALWRLLSSGPRPIRTILPRRTSCTGRTGSSHHTSPRADANWRPVGRPATEPPVMTGSGPHQPIAQLPGEVGGAGKRPAGQEGGLQIAVGAFDQALGLRIGRRAPGAVAADKAYSSRGNRAYLRGRRIKAVTPEKRDQAAKRKNKGSEGGRARQSRHRPVQGTEYRRTPDQQAEGLARHRHPLRQNPCELPRRPPPPCRDDLDQRPHPDQPLITTRYAP